MYIVVFYIALIVVLGIFFLNKKTSTLVRTIYLTQINTLYIVASFVYLCFHKSITSVEIIFLCVLAILGGVGIVLRKRFFIVCGNTSNLDDVLIEALTKTRSRYNVTNTVYTVESKKSSTQIVIYPFQNALGVVQFKHDVDSRRISMIQRFITKQFGSPWPHITINTRTHDTSN